MYWFKARSFHQPIAATTGLQAALDGKVDDADLTAHNAAVDPHPGYLTPAEGSAAYAPLSHNQAISTVTGLQAALDAKIDDIQLSAFGLTVVDDADASAARATLGLGSAAISASTAFETAGAVAAHASAGDPHPVYLTATEGNAAYAAAAHVGSGGTAHANVVAAGAAGFMSGADKTKLDAISGTNTGDQTITLSGDIGGSGTAAITATLATVNAAPQTDTLRKITVNGKGLVTATSAVVAADIPTLNQNTSGSAATLTTGRTFSLSGDGTGTSSAFNGSANASIPLTLATVNSNVGSFGSASLVPVITVNGKGLVTAVSTVAVSGGGSISDGDKGDITVSAGGAAWEIDAGVVSNAKLGNVPTASFKGRITAATGAPEDLTATQATSLLDVATIGAKGLLSAADKGKLDGIATGATANATDAALRDRSTHTGTQPASTISDFSGAADARIGAASVNALADVVVTAPSTGQVLKYNGSAFVNDTDATGGGGVSDGDKGDITVSGSGATWTIDAGVVGTAELGGDITTAGKALLDDANATAQRATLGLATVAATGSAADLTGDLPIARLNAGTGANSTTYWRGDGTWATPDGGGGGSDPWTWAKLGSDVANSTTTLAEVTGLSFTATANTTYIIEVIGTFTSAATTTGIAIALDIPSGSVTGQARANLTAATIGAVEQIADNATTGTTTGVRAATTNTPLTGRFIVAVGGSGGTVRLMFRSEVASSAVTMKANLTALGYRSI